MILSRALQASRWIPAAGALALILQPALTIATPALASSSGVAAASADPNAAGTGAPADSHTAPESVPPPSGPKSPSAKPTLDSVRALLHEDKWEEALAAARALGEHDPNAAPAKALLGDALYRRGDFEEAEEAYRSAALLDPNHAPAHFGLGRIFRTLGRYAEAAPAFHRAAALEPENARYARILSNHLAKRADQLALLERYLELPGAEDENVRKNVRAWMSLLREIGDAPLNELARAEPSEIPINVLKGQAYFRAEVQGAGSVRFAFDTGATGVTISPRAAKAAKLKPIRDFTITAMGGKGTVSGDLVVLGSLSAGGVSLRNVTATVTDPAGPEEGLIGPSIFGAMRIGIDLDGGALRLTPHPAVAPPGSQPPSPPEAARTAPAAGSLVLPFRNVGGQIVVKASLDGVPLNAMVDTGASSSFISMSAAGRAPQIVLLPGSWSSSVGFGLGGAIPRKIVRAGTLSFGGREFKADGMACVDLSRFSRALESEIYIVIGSPQLARFLLEIDYRTNTLTLIPRES